MVKMKMKKKIDIEIIDKKQIPQSEPERQYYFMDIAKNYVEQLSAKKGSPQANVTKLEWAKRILYRSKDGTGSFFVIYVEKEAIFEKST